ncbi:MAG: T9SS type A sorting domain-containing protein [bacterium]
MLKWQSSVSPFTSWSDISGATTTTYTSGALTATTQFMAVVRSGVCGELTSGPTTVTVDNPSVGGTAASAQTICHGTSPANLTVSGYTGAVVKWQKSADVAFTSPTDIAETSSTLSGSTIGALTANTWFRAAVQNGVCSVAYSTAVKITVDPLNVGGTVTGGSTVCTGSTSGLLTLTGNTGSVIKWQFAEIGADWTDIANVELTYTSGALTATTQFRAIVQSGTCSATFSESATVTVSPASVGGSVASGQTICHGSSPADLTLTGNTGGVVKWQKSTDEAFTSPTDIAGTSATLSGTTIGALTANTWFRAVVKNSVCAEANSSSVLITIDPPSIGGTVSGAAHVCAGSNSTTLTLSGNTGTVQVWQWSINGTDWSDISGATASTYAATNLIATTHYRAVVKNGTCSSANSSPATVTVDPISIGGNVAGSGSVCTGSNSTVLTLSGQTGTVQMWQWSTDGTNWNDITGATSTTYTATGLTTTTQYRAVVLSGICSSSANSSAAIITVDPVSVGGTISGSATVCSTSNSTPLTLSGQTGETLQWQLSSNGTDWYDISGATAATYTAGGLTSTTHYHVVVQSGACPSVLSGEATVTVDPASVGGSVSGGTTVCTGSNSTVLTLSGHTGTVLRWQWSTDGNNWNNISAATTATYTASSLTATTQYRAVVQSGICGSANSDPATVAVNAASAGGAVSGATHVCTGINSTELTLTGNTGTIQTWQSSVNGTDWSDIAGATSGTYTAANLTSTTHYRVVVKSGVCDPANSSTAIVTVDPASDGGSVTGGTTVCSSSNSTLLTLGTHTGVVQRWQYSTNGGSVWNDIAGATAVTYTASGVTATSQYHALVKSGTCDEASSSATTITVDPASIGGAVTGGTNVCTGTNSTMLTLGSHTGAALQWQQSTNGGGNWADISGATTATYTAGNLTATTMYHVVVQSGICAAATSSPATITVNPASVGGSVSGTTTVCTGGNSTVLTLTGSMGSVLKWQSSTNGGVDWIDIDGATTATYTAENLIATAQFRVVVQSGACASANSGVAVITVDPYSVGGSVSGGTTVCSGSNSTLLTLSSQTGTVTMWQWSVNGTDWTNITGATSTSYTASGLTATTQFRAVVKSGACSQDYSSPETVTVDPVSVGGTITGGGITVCSGNNSTNLTLTGNTGTVLQWQVSTNGTDWTNISGATTTTYTSGNVSVTTHYRVTVQSGVCSSVNSASTALTVDPSIGGTITGGTTVCTGTNSTLLTLTTYSGTIQMWQFSTDEGATWNNLAMFTTATYTATDLTTTTMYRVVVATGSCNAAYSTIATVTVSPATVGGAVAGDASVCRVVNSTILTLSGHTGTVQKWQWSLNGSTWYDVSGATGTTYTASALTATTMYHAVVKSGACASVESSSATVTVYERANSYIVVDEHIKCFGGNNGHATVTAPGGTTGFSYIWNNGQTTAAATGLTAGNYSVTVTDTHGCNEISSTTITQPGAALVVSVTAQTNVLCHGNATGAATVTATYGTPGYTFIWSSGQSSAAITGLVAGSYTVTVTDAHGCTTSTAATITQPDAVLTAPASVVNHVSIYLGSDGVATVTPAGGTPGYSYSWSTSPVQTTQSATGLSVGSYQVTVTDAHSCKAYSDVTITQPICPTVQASSLVFSNIGSTQVKVTWARGNGDGCTVFIYQGSAGTALPVNNVSYPANTVFGDPSSQVGSSGWYCVYDGTGTSVTVTGLTVSTTYRVHVCEYKLGSKTYNVAGATDNPANSTTYPQFLANASVVSHVNCFGENNGSVTVSVSGGNPTYTYVWSSAPAQTTQSATGLIAGSYTVTVTDGVGATVTSGATITQPTLLVATASVVSNVSCFQEANGAASTTVNGGSGSYTYTWSTNPVQHTAGATGLTAGTYTITVSDAHTCTATATVEITQPAILALTASVANILCNTGNTGAITTTVTGGTTPYIYTWSNGQATPAISGLSPGIYAVTVTDSHGCSKTGSWEVLGSIMNIVGPNAVCCSPGNSSVYQATIVNGCNSRTYQWAISGGTIKSGWNTSTITVEWSCCGSGSLALVINNCNGCLLTKTLAVTVTTPPAPSISGPATVTAGQQGTQYCAPYAYGHFYVWVVSGGSISSGQGSSCITVDCGGYPICGCGFVAVHETGNGCTGTVNYPVAIQPGNIVSISGYVAYDNNYLTKMNGVTIQLRNSLNVISGTAVSMNHPVTGEPGYYAFTDLPNDTYTLRGSYNGTWGGNNATDALIVQLNVIGSYPLSGLRQVVADVNASTTITGLDALYIKLRTIGSIASYPAGDWKISEKSVALSGTPVVQDLTALCTGDVNGTFIPLGFKETTFLSIISDSVITVPVGEPFKYDIRTSRDAELGAMTLFLGYDSDRYEVVEILNQEEGMKYSFGDGKISIAWTDTKPLKVKADDLLLSLKLRVKDAIAEPAGVFSIGAGSEFADILASPYENFDLKMPDVLTADGSQEITMFNYPNPFAGTTTIVYTLPEQGHVKLVLTDLYGKTIQTLTDRPENSGSHAVTVDPAALHMAPGVYMYKIIFDDTKDTYVKVNKMVFTR